MSKDTNITLNLSLPFVELKKGNDPWAAESYENSGIYFVKDREGVFRLADVDKEDNTVTECPIPINVGNLLLSEVHKNNTEELLDNIDKRLQDILQKVSRLVESDYCDVENGINVLHNRLESLEGRIDNNTEDSIKHIISNARSIEDGIAAILKNVGGSNPDGKPASGKGNISEETLLEIIKTIRR